MYMRLARIVRRKDGRWADGQTDNAKTITPTTDVGCNDKGFCAPWAYHTPLVKHGGT